MKIYYIDNVEELYKVQSQWEDIYNSSNSKTNPFLNFYRVLALFNLNKTIQKFKTRIAVVERDNKIVMFLPLSIRKIYAFINVIYFAGAEFADYNDFLINPQYEYLIEDVLKKILSRRDICILRGIKEESKLLKPFLTLHSHSEETTHSPYINLVEKSSDYYEVSDESAIKDARYNIRRLSKNGKIDFVIIKKENYKSEFEKLVTMHQHEWNSKGMHSMFDDYRCIQYYNELFKQSDCNKQLFMSKVIVNDVVISYFFGFIVDNSLLYYKPTYSIEHSKFSPGKIHIYFLIKYCVENKIPYFDFMVGVEEYKFKWTNEVTPIFSKFISKSNFLVSLMKQKERMKYEKDR